MKRAALITGSSGLIGRELCREFISQGFHVYGVDLKSQEKKENFTPVMCDISKEEEVAGVFQDIEALHVLINNGAKSDPYNKKIHELELSEWNKIMATNLTSVFLLSKYAVPLLKKTQGAIINISSTRHKMCEPDTEIYSTTKGGIVSLTRAMSISLAPLVRVNSISPGWIHDPTENLSPDDHHQHPVGRVGVPADISKLALYLSGEDSSFVTGQDFIVDGGMTVKMIYQE
jgi:NAD(P)-dependent dehydrogenase (short-subunit alcohol dehydrogenase family)